MSLKISLSDSSLIIFEESFPGKKTLLYKTNPSNRLEMEGIDQYPSKSQMRSNKIMKSANWSPKGSTLIQIEPVRRLGSGLLTNSDDQSEELFLSSHLSEDLKISEALF